MVAFPLFASFRSVDSILHNPIIIPGEKIVTMPGQFAAGQQLMPGTVIGLITATNLLIASVKTAADGSQVPFGIMLEPLDTTVTGPAGVAGPTNGTFLSRGTVNASAIVADPSWGVGPDAAWVNLMGPLRAIGILGRFPGFSG